MAVGLTQASMAMPVYADSACPESGLQPVGEVHLIPDPTTFREAPWRTGHLLCMARMMTIGGLPWCCCPRNALSQAVAHAERTVGLHFKVGFELEFILLQPEVSGMSTYGVPLAPIDDTPYCSTRAVEGCWEVLEDIIHWLQLMGIPVSQYHAESAPGQYEVALGPADPLTACDNLVMAREVITAAAMKHNMEVTFLPKYFSKAAGNGCHCHISMYKEGVNELGGQGELSTEQSDVCLKPIGRSFLAGLLHHLPSLLPFLAASVNSYRRLAPGCWSGCYQVWGFDNREAPLRVTCPPGDSQGVNIEVKAFDHTANPHLGVAAIIVGGLTGASHSYPLPEPVQVDPASLVVDPSSSTPVTPLPTCLKEALVHYRRDQTLSAAMTEVVGADILRAYLAVKACEAEREDDVEGTFLKY